MRLLSLVVLILLVGCESWQKAADEEMLTWHAAFDACLESGRDRKTCHEALAEDLDNWQFHAGEVAPKPLGCVMGEQDGRNVDC